MTVATVSRNGKTAVSEVSNGAKALIEQGEPYIARVSIEGVAPILFHRMDCDSVEEKAKAKKGARQKKADDIES